EEQDIQEHAVEDLAEEGQDEEGQAVEEQEVINKRTSLTDEQRVQVYEALLQRSNNLKLKRKTSITVANLFGIPRSLVRSIWRKAMKCREQGIPVDLKSKKVLSGRRKVEVDLSQVAAIPLRKRTTIRSLASELKVSRSTLHRAFKEGKIRRHSNTLKPYLKDANKKSHLRYCVSMIDPNSVQDHPTFIDMRCIVHIDEKWFYTTRKARRFYMLPEEQNPLRTVQNKNSIDKVMFLCALARPRYDANGNCTFDGKLGVWPFVKEEPAKRKSDYRPRGTPITKPINVKRETSREFLIEKVIPAIVASWPQEDAGKTIWIQQDNARTHVPADDEAFENAVAKTGLDIRIMHQPPNSPDMNVLDLGFFASLQSLTLRKNNNNMVELIQNVAKEFEEYDADSVNRVFLTLQGCCIEVMMAGGGNGYKIPHMNKERMERLGTLPISLSCDLSLYESVMKSLAE
ncbi:unnamed protein product, partial [Urochloa humidicola]